MNDVDLLRRAAAKLRDAVEALPDVWRASWRTVMTDSESIDGVAVCPRTDHDEVSACDYCWHFEATSEYVATLVVLAAEPAVVLALANLLDANAVTLDEMGSDERTNVDEAAIATARLVLGGPRVHEHEHTWIEPTFPGFPRFCMCGARENES